MCGGTKTPPVVKIGNNRQFSRQKEGQNHPHHARVSLGTRRCRKLGVSQTEKKNNFQSGSRDVGLGVEEGAMARYLSTKKSDGKRDRTWEGHLYQKTNSRILAGEICNFG